ncbi:MAG: flagellar biosynthesis protein FlhF [Phycisphaerae bacterium]
MKVKTFSGKTMAEALDKLKRQFGRSAVILSTRALTKGGWLGFGGTPCVEITAARRMADLPAPLRRGRLARQGRGGDDAEGAATVSSRVTVASDTRADSVLFEVGALKSLVGEVLQETRRLRAGHVPEPLYATYRKLIENEVGHRIAEALIASVQRSLAPDELSDQDAVRRRLAAALESMLPTAGPIQITTRDAPTVVAFIGPTGVGKTTTVAKLAANFSLRERRRVGLVTIDTYRIAAVEQLRTYAEIIGVPLQVVATPAELASAVGRLNACDVILIDTAGRSQRDALKIGELKRFFDAVRPHEVHLVVSGTCGERVMAETIERFSGVGVDRVIVTKLDEAIGFGVILTCLEHVDAGLSYVTTGQDVPDDIEVGERGRLAAMILGDRPHGRSAASASGGDETASVGHPQAPVAVPRATVGETPAVMVHPARSLGHQPAPG